ncbi:transforming growth factor beta activator LRRC32 [Polypterus senegalus]|uniref:transforming growth factor beta activator LRRC32 n=1 Tax=Polypterus senegalus TaxID=55291 RepID=UPI001962D715|nr:transforming growth factor beta activator LRRC32 [Polypterus senegalus]
MGPRLMLLLAVVNEVVATFRPRHLSPCRVEKTYVYCNSLNLKHIPSDLPPDIQVLDMSYNFLQNLTDEFLSYYTSIHELNLYNNEVSFVQPGLFKDFANLENLDLSKNHLDQFAQLTYGIGPLPKVKTLDLSSNGLYSSMPPVFLHNASALLNVSLSRNSITKIDKDTFSGASALKSIDLSNNVILEIEDGAFDSLPDLTELNLSTNSITCIVDFNLIQLKLLNLSKNSIESFHTTDSENEHNLLYLDLSENKILYFPVLPKRNKLIYLDLSRNLLQTVSAGPLTDDPSYISYSWFAETTSSWNKTISGSGTETNLTKLLYLDLSYNEIKSISDKFFSTMRSLELLNLSNNCLVSFTVGSDTLNSLDTLDLNFNALQNLSFASSALRFLKKLYLKSNNLQTLEAQVFIHLPQIQLIDLQENHVSICEYNPTSPGLSCSSNKTDCIFLAGIPSLLYLYLSSNTIKYIPQYAFYGTPLLVLDVSNNKDLQLHEKSFFGLDSSLKYLYLHKNSLQSLTVDISLLTGIKHVILSDNQLTELSPWNKESSIEVLDLRNNKLPFIQHHTVTILKKSLKRLYISGNPLDCCSNSQFIHMVLKSTVEIPEINVLKCHFSNNPELNELPFLNVSQEDCDKQDAKIITIVIIIIMALFVSVFIGLISRCYRERRLKSRGSYKARPEGI